MEVFEFNKDVDEMSEKELKATVRDFQERHNEQVQEAGETEELVSEYSEKIDELEAEQDVAVAYFADKASEVTNISEEILSARFSVDELVEMAGEADEVAFSEVQQGGETDETDEADEADETVFADKEQKSPAFSQDNVDARKEAAKERLSRLGGVSF